MLYLIYFIALLTLLMQLNLGGKIMAKIDEKFTALEGKFTTLSSEVGESVTKIEELRDEIAALKEIVGDPAALETRIDALAEKADQLAAGLDAAQNPPPPEPV